MASLVDWLFMIVRAAGNPYLGVFLVSLLGNMTVFFPVPYLVLIFTIAIEISTFSIIPLTILGALGATIGKFVSYMIGYGGRVTLGERYKSRFDSLRRLLGGSPFFAAFIFALSPLPDDVVFIPLGMMQYSPLKTFLACFLGKFFLTLIAIWTGRFSRSAISWFTGPENSYTLWISIVAIIIATIIMIKVDWGKLLLKEDKGKHDERR